MTLLTFDANRPAATPQAPASFRHIVRLLATLRQQQIDSPEPDADEPPPAYDAVAYAIRYFAKDATADGRPPRRMLEALGCRCGLGHRPNDAAAAAVVDALAPLRALITPRPPRSPYPTTEEQLAATVTRMDSDGRRSLAYWAGIIADGFRDEEHAAGSIGGLLASRLTRQQQAAVGLEIARRATSTQRRSRSDETAIDHTSADAARRQAILATLEQMDETDRTHAAALVAGVAAYRHDPKPFRAAIAAFIRERLGLEDIQYVLTAATKMLKRWAHYAGAERPAFPTPGRARKGGGR